MKRLSQPHVHAPELAAEIVRRAAAMDSEDADFGSGVICLSDPPTPQERLQLLAASLQGRRVAVMRRHCMTAEEWIAHYCVADTAGGR